MKIKYNNLSILLFVKFIFTLFITNKITKLFVFQQYDLIPPFKHPISVHSLMSTRTRYLVDDLNRTFESFHKSNQNPESPSRQSFLVTRKKDPSPSKLTKQLSIAKHNYQDLTNMTKQQQRQLVWKSMLSEKKKKKEWTHSYYTGNNKLPHASKTFSVFENKNLDDFPDNNTKYNVQFLERSLHGTSLKFPRSESGEFKKPSNSLYSRHYRPIVKEKLKFNEDWELRTSLFDKTWVDHKRDRIMNDYQLQTNPFKTPKSNTLIASMTKSQVY